MQGETEHRKKELAWGLLASMLLHIVPVLLFLMHWPVASYHPPEETVTVDMVPPSEEKKPAPKPEEAPKPPDAKVEKADRAPDATMLAVPPPPPRKDIPESDRFAGATKPEKPETPVETAPKPDETAKPAEDNRPPPGENTPRPPSEAQASAPDAPKQEDTAKALSEAPDILAAKEGSGVSAPDNPPVPPPVPSAQPAKQPEPPGQGVKDAPPLKRAKVLSNARLNDPLQRMALGQLPLKKRIVQLCTFEALAQIMQARPGTQLHGMVPYGDHQDRIQGNVLNATGGAYRTMAGDWFDISFRCAVNADDMTVTSFSFHLGDKKVTRAERKARGLPAD